MAVQAGDFIKVSDDNWRFVHAATGEYFVPIGCNYFPSGIGWAPRVWEMFNPGVMEADFSTMGGMGMNIIRVFLTMKSFMPEDGMVSPQAMEKCGKLLDMAGKHGIRVIYSGPSLWEGSPQWASDILKEKNSYFVNDKILSNLANFWMEFGKAFSGRPELFSIDLQNEPYLEWDLSLHLDKWRNFLKEKYGSVAALNDAWRGSAAAVPGSWDGVAIPDDANSLNDPAIWDYQLFRNKLSRGFTLTCVNAIRAHDDNHMISIGCHQGTVPFDGWTPSRYFVFDPHYIGDLLDYVSLHLYPFDENMDLYASPENYEKNMAMLQASLAYMDIGKPVVLEEYGLYGGGAPPKVWWRKPFDTYSQKQQADWTLESMDRTKGLCCGWLNWGLKDYAESKDSTRYSGFFDDSGELKEMGRRFPAEAAAARLWAQNNPKPAREARIDLDLKALVTDGATAQAFKELAISAFRNNPNTGIYVIR